MFLRQILLLASVILINQVNANWTDLNTGINSDLNGVVFFGNNGMVSSPTGLYYTTNGGNGSSSWTRFDITTNTNDSIIYNQTKFTHCFSNNATSNIVFACGQDTVNLNAIIFQVELPSLNYTILYTGAANSKLNNIDYSQGSGNYFAVGENGLLVKFDDQVTGTALTTNTTHDFIALDNYGNRLTISSGNRIFKCNYTQSSGLTIADISMPGSNFLDLKHVSNSNFYAVGPGFYSANVSGSTTEHQDYNYGPLNARCITYYTASHRLVGTDHGIFRTVANTTILEWQPTSQQTVINEFWNEAGSNYIYACGDNGVVLKTANGGGISQPYVKILTTSGGCVGTNIYLNAITGSSGNCQWFINDSLIHTGCSGYNHPFSQAGTFQLKVVGTNGAYADSSEVAFTVVSTPQINLTTSLSDSLLCHEESITVTLDSTEQDVVYRLFDDDIQSYFGTSGPGNDSTISFNTSLIDDAGYYILKAKSTLANCENLFTDSIFIDIEETTAYFHTDLINAQPGENVRFHEQCTDAMYYNWTFPSGASQLQSSQPNPIVSFTSFGQQLVQLNCWTDQGCSDSIAINSVNIYNLPATTDSCWYVQSFNSDTIMTSARPFLQGFSKANGGYLYNGAFINADLSSNYGIGQLLNGKGGFLSKYSDDGVLRWTVKGSVTDSNLVYSSSYAMRLKHAIEDLSGNVYVVGHLRDHFVDNRGDTIFFPDNHAACIVKLDHLGKVIWYRTSPGMTPYKIAIDQSNNPIIFSWRNASGSIPLSFNGAPSDTLIPQAYQYGDYGMTKFNASVAVVWDIPFLFNSVNASLDRLVKAETDSLNNIYLAGIFEVDVEFFPTNYTNGYTIDNTNLVSLGSKTFIVKLDSNGNFLWKMRSYTKYVPTPPVEQTG